MGLDKPEEHAEQKCVEVFFFNFNGKTRQKKRIYIDKPEEHAEEKRVEVDCEDDRSGKLEKLAPQLVLVRLPKKLEVLVCLPKKLEKNKTCFEMVTCC